MPKMFPPFWYKKTLTVAEILEIIEILIKATLTENNEINPSYKSFHKALVTVRDHMATKEFECLRGLVYRLNSFMSKSAAYRQLH
jgi:hypothetical protein